MGSPGSGPPAKVITIGVDSQGNPTASPSDQIIWSTLGDEVKWLSSGLSFVVNFAAGTPFAASTFNGPIALSGSIQSGATGPYKYSVQVGTKILDPKVIVRP